MIKNLTLKRAMDMVEDEMEMMELEPSSSSSYGRSGHRIRGNSSRGRSSGRGGRSGRGGGRGGGTFRMMARNPSRDSDQPYRAAARPKGVMQRPLPTGPRAKTEAPKKDLVTNNRWSRD